jgi:hypothetical protein
MTTMLSVLVGLACAYKCSLMARDRNRRVALWAALGFVGGLVAVLVVHFLKPVAARPAAAVIGQGDGPASQEAVLSLDAAQ